MDSTCSANVGSAGGVKIPDDSTVRTRNSQESLEPSQNKTPSLSKECSFSASNVLHHKTPPPSSKVAPDSTNPWQEKAFEFYDQVAQQVERLLQSSVEDEASIEKTLRDELKQARVPSGYHSTTIRTLHTFSRNTNVLVTRLHEIELQQPVDLEPLICS